VTNLERVISSFIVHEMMFDSVGSSLGFDDPLLETGILDSAGVVQLTLFLETEFEVSIPSDDLVPEHFDSVQSIANYLKTRIPSQKT